MKNKWLLIVGIILVVIIVSIFIAYQMVMKDYDKRMNNLVISNVNLSKVDDGTYKGSYKLFPITVELNVTVLNHKITAINIIKHINGKGKPAEIITDEVIEKQSLDVDTISGATGSSKVILKAIENALNNK